MKHHFLFMVALGLALCMTGAPVLGDDFFVVGAAQAGPLRSADQIVYLSDTITQTGPNMNVNLSSIRRVDANGVLTTFIIPTGKVFVLIGIRMHYYIQGTRNTYDSSYADFKIGNFYYQPMASSLSSSYNDALGVSSTFSADGVDFLSYDPGIVISSNAWNSNAITVTIDNRAGYVFTSSANLKVIMHGYLANF